jgi:hypothetical protein
MTLRLNFTLCLILELLFFSPETFYVFVKRDNIIVIVIIYNVIINNKEHNIHLFVSAKVTCEQITVFRNCCYFC